MIEQTELIVSEWHYRPPINFKEGEKKITSHTSLDVMKKTAATKKGLACRFSCRFDIGNDTVLDYVGENSYVIDLEDSIDKGELLTMIRNSFSKFKEKFDIRKFGTVLHTTTLSPVDETRIDLDAILPLLA